MLDDELEQRSQVGPFRSGDARRPAGLRIGIDDRELDLLLGGVQVEEQLKHLVLHLRDAGVGPVHLVDDEDDRQPAGQGFAKHEPGLRQRTLGGVHQEQNAVDHGQRPLDLAAEVGVAGSVDDIQLHLAVADGRVLGENRDSPLALLVHRIHDALDHLLVRGEHAGLAKHGVDQARLAVVDVRDDGDVADVLPLRHASDVRRARVAGRAGPTVVGYFLPARPEARDLVAADFPACLVASPAAPAAFFAALTTPPAARFAEPAACPAALPWRVAAALVPALCDRAFFWLRCSRRSCLLCRRRAVSFRLGHFYSFASGAGPVLPVHPDRTQLSSATSGDASCGRGV